MDEPYAGICGITEDELVNGMRNDIDALAEKLILSYEQTLAKLKDNYDGYHFIADIDYILNKILCAYSSNFTS